MDPTLRALYNAAFTEERYQSYLRRLEKMVGEPVPFPVAETPLFLPRDLRDRLAKNATEIVEQICNPALIAHTSKAVPAHLDVPNRDAFSNCIQVDFAIVRDEQGRLDGKLVELQGFPSLYGLMVLQLDALSEEMQSIPGLNRDWSLFFGGLDRARYVETLRKAIVADYDPETVILMDLKPEEQKTRPDFVATKQLLGVDAICPTTLEREGKQLYRRIGNRKVPVKRIYNRVVFDELFKTGAKLPFVYTDPLDVSWFPHPNWYWIWSKYTIPYLDHPSVPKATFVSELKEIPDDLENYVLKPLFSFAGAGVKVDITKADIDGIPDQERNGWILQRKITYEPALTTPDWNGVKAEVRMMFLWADDAPRPRLVMNLVRLSRGKMLGVDHNKNLKWVGGTVGIWPASEGVSY
ncbi:MAG: hypothetical protein U0165_13105 [Polyangiaceae bacterium]